MEECAISCAWWIRTTAGTKGAPARQKRKKEKKKKKKKNKNQKQITMKIGNVKGSTG